MKKIDKIERMNVDFIVIKREKRLLEKQVSNGKGEKSGVN